MHTDEQTNRQKDRKTNRQEPNGDIRCSVHSRLDSTDRADSTSYQSHLRLVTGQAPDRMCGMPHSIHSSIIATHTVTYTHKPLVLLLLTVLLLLVLLLLLFVLRLLQLQQLLQY